MRKRLEFRLQAAVVEYNPFSPKRKAPPEGGTPNAFLMGRLLIHGKYDQRRLLQITKMMNGANGDFEPVSLYMNHK